MVNGRTPSQQQVQNLDDWEGAVWGYLFGAVHRILKLHTVGKLIWSSICTNQFMLLHIIPWPIVALEGGPLLEMYPMV